ncbi:MAG: DUF3348 family protein [Halieaceae bacterium]|jgi:hypothetical protein|nr:DUF3348 family protein [Halieaceae bacterium]
MTQAQTQIHAHSSRLARLLAELTGADTAGSDKLITERMGQLFDLPDSIRISSVLDRPAPAPAQPAALTPQEARAEFLRARSAIISSALRSFVPGGGSIRLRFPPIATREDFEEAATADVLLAFYATQQRDIDFRIRQLQAITRDTVAAFSPRLAQLAALDAALAEPLAAHNRQFFSAVCTLLGKRIGFLLEEYQQAASADPGGGQLWADTLTRLRSDMQALLLAEIETRLLPALGLIEALDEPDDE